MPGHSFRYEEIKFLFESYFVRYGSENDIELSRMKLSHTIMTNHELRTTFYRSDGSISVSDANDWLNGYNQLQECMAFLVHIASGLPARAKEEETFLLRNSNSCLRTLFVLQDRIVLIPHYSKTQSITQSGRLVARFLDPLSSKLLLTDLIFLRPFATYLMKKLGMENYADYHNFLFVRNNQRMQVQAIRNNFIDLSNHYFEVHLLFKAWRQLASNACYDCGIDPKEWLEGGLRS